MLQCQVNAELDFVSIMHLDLFFQFSQQFLALVSNSHKLFVREPPTAENGKVSANTRPFGSREVGGEGRGGGGEGEEGEGVGGNRGTQ